jgi:hypothetical protein
MKTTIAKNKSAIRQFWTAEGARMPSSSYEKKGLECSRLMQLVRKNVKSIL